MKKIIIRGYISEALFKMMEEDKDWSFSDGTPVFTVKSTSPSIDDNIIQLMLESKIQKDLGWDKTSYGQDNGCAI